MNISTKTPIIIILLLLISAPYTRAEDYQYQYFKQKGKKYVPFSDYIPKIRLHYQTVPHYLEDYYLLYGMKQYYNENSLRKNIDTLKIAMQSKFRHPSNALIKIESEDEYLKYRRLMFMHINMLIMRNYLKIATRYDKHNIYFYHKDFSKEILDSLSTAEVLYRQALPYWEKAKEYAIQASQIKITTDLGFIESERRSIIDKEIDFAKIIETDLRKIQEKKIRLNAMDPSVKQ